MGSYIYDHKVTVEERDLQGVWVEAHTYYPAK